MPIRLKKIIRILPQAALSLLVILLVPVLVYSSQVQVIDVQGKVELSDAGQENYYPAEKGLVLYPRDKIKTQKDSAIELGFGENKDNIVRVEENTYAVLLIQEDEKIELLKGRIFTILQNLPPGQAFEIRTPTAVAGARGTEWITETDGQETTVESYSGKPYMQSFDKEGKLMGQRLFVAPGKMTRAPRFALPEAAVNLPENKIKQWNNLRPLIQERAKKSLMLPKIYHKPAAVKGIQGRIKRGAITSDNRAVKFVPVATDEKKKVLFEKNTYKVNKTAAQTSKINAVDTKANNKVTKTKVIEKKTVSADKINKNSAFTLK